MITNAVKIYHLDLHQLIIDATRIKIWKDEETDLVRFGYCSRNERKINYSFGELKELIRSGNAVEGFYENENLKKKLKIWGPIKLGDELEEIFRKLMIKIPGFDVEESTPTDF